MEKFPHSEWLHRWRCRFLTGSKLANLNAGGQCYYVITYIHTYLCVRIYIHISSILCAPRARGLCVCTCSVVAWNPRIVTYMNKSHMFLTVHVGCLEKIVYWLPVSFHDAVLGSRQYGSRALCKRVPYPPYRRSSSPSLGPLLRYSHPDPLVKGLLTGANLPGHEIPGVCSGQVWHNIPDKSGPISFLYIVRWNTIK